MGASTTHSYGSDETAEETVAETAEAADETPAEEPAPSAEEQAPEPVAEEAAAEEPVAESAPAEDTSTGPKFVANNRPEALALIEKVLSYYRTAEPSSPVALILERALAMSTKNFIGLMREVLPDGHLKDRVVPDAGSGGGGWS